jgi:hypothetical protein
MNKDQKQIIKRIDQAFSKLYILSNITWTSYRDIIFNMNREDEKKHRSGDWQEYHKNSASINDCARMFTVKNIAESLLNEDRYKVKDLLNIRKSCIYCQSLVNNYGDRIKKAWIDEDINYLANLDYISLIDWESYKEKEVKSA